MHDQVLVVGGGLAGLTAAAVLARGGVAVEVLEASADLGGRARTTDVDGFRLNLGPHALYRDGAGARVLAGLGVRPAGRAPGSAGFLRYEGELFPLSLVPRARPGRSLLSLRERGQLIKALAATQAPRANLAEGSMADWVAERTSAPRPRAALGALVRISTYAADLGRLPARIGVGQLRIALRRSVWYLHDGWGALVDELETVAQTAGARVRRGARVVALAPDAGWPGVRLADGTERRGRAVVLAGLAPAAAGRLLTDAGAEPPAWLRAPVPVLAACLDVALRALPRPDRSFVLGADEPLYLRDQAPWARVAPAGGAVVHAARYLSGAAGSAHADRAWLEARLDQAQPGWREQLVHARFLARMHVIRHLPAPGEARPAIDASGLERVLLAGDWVGPEGWLADAAVASGQAAAQAALRLAPATVARRGMLQVA